MATFNLRQGGIIVASATAEDTESARREVMHYAMIYSQDGPVAVEGPVPDDWCPECGEKCDCGLMDGQE